nr:MAG TPA: hypothetical protein [Bacteriophage sp.]DAS09655.1 MAG TPA: hypothetical protein [Bacteriophage sp.]
MGRSYLWTIIVLKITEITIITLRVRMRVKPCPYSNRK